MTRRITLAVSVVAVAMFSMAAAARAAVLYDQTDHAGTPNANADAPNFAPSNNFGGGDFDRTADDFNVPAGQAWVIDGVDVSGAYFDRPPGVVNVYLYPDAGGRPGATLFSQTGIAASGGPNYVVPVANAPSLTPGTYWVTIQQAGAGDAGYWSWTTRTIKSGRPARWFGAGADCLDFRWNLRTVCWAGTNPDQVFRLRGLNTQNQITLGKLKRNKMKGTATLPVTVPGAGELTLSGKKVKARKAAEPLATRAVARSGVVKLVVKAKGKAAKKLKRTGKTKVKVTITYTPTAGVSNSQQKKVKLKRKLKQ
jgi:hypothetical protein